MKNPSKLSLKQLIKMAKQEIKEWKLFLKKLNEETKTIRSHRDDERNNRDKPRYAHSSREDRKTRK